MGRHTRAVVVKSLKNQAVIADKCNVAERFFTRLRGLIGKSGMQSGEGMLFPRCNDIHMYFMSIPIDVVFVRKTSDEKKYRVTSAHSNVRPWKALPLRDGKASETLELPSGTIQRFEIHAGDELCIS